MDEIEKRLRDVTETCLKAYQAWNGARKSAESRETLQDAIHELRKATARLEIDIAVSERDEMNQRQIPIPPHRATRKGHSEEEESYNSGNESEGNRQPSGNAPGGGAPRHVLRRRSQGGGQAGPRSEE